MVDEHRRGDITDEEQKYETKSHEDNQQLRDGQDLVKLELKPSYQSEKDESYHNDLRQHSSNSGEDKMSQELNQDAPKCVKVNDATETESQALDVKMQNSSSDEKGCGKGKSQKRYWTEQEVSKLYFIRLENGCQSKCQ